MWESSKDRDGRWGGGEQRDCGAGREGPGNWCRVFSKQEGGVTAPKQQGQ